MVKQCDLRPHAVRFPCAGDGDDSRPLENSNIFAALGADRAYKQPPTNLAALRATAQVRGLSAYSKLAGSGWAFDASLHLCSAFGLPQPIRRQDLARRELRSRLLGAPCQDDAGPGDLTTIRSRRSSLLVHHCCPCCAGAGVSGINGQRCLAICRRRRCPGTGVLVVGRLSLM